MKLSKVQGIIVFTVLVSLCMSAIMSFGLLLYNRGWVANFFHTWLYDYFLVDLWLSLPVGFTVVPLMKKLVDQITVSESSMPAKNIEKN